jgi:hypothetical protein
VREYEDLDNDAVEARVCSRTTPLLDASVGLYRLAVEGFQANEGEQGLARLRCAAVALLNPFALIHLARLEFHGPDAVRRTRPELELSDLTRDPTSAFVHAWAGFILGTRMNRAIRDEQLQEALTWSAMLIVDSFASPELRAELDEAAAEALLAALRAQHERRYGPVAEWPTFSGGRPE